MSDNPFRPPKKETYEDQLDLSASPNLLEGDLLEDVGLSQTESVSQPFLETSSNLPSSGLIGPPKAAQPNAPVSSSEQANSSQGFFSSICGFLSVEYYRPYFDVSTALVFERMKNGMMPNKADIFGEESQPDLYGVVWISLTLIFLIGATSNLNSYLAHSTSEPWERDYQLLSFAASVIFTYAFIIPIVLWGAVLYSGNSNGVRLSLIRIFAIYGYALTCFIPASMICAVPSAPLQWTTVAISGLVSGIVLARNLATTIGTSYSPLSQDIESQAPLSENNSGRNRNVMIVSAALLVHAVFVLLLKLFFFQGAELAGIVNPGDNKTI